MAHEISQRSDIRELHSKSEKLGSVLDVQPSSNLLAWFTNTKNYKTWVAAEGGSLYYPISQQTMDGFGCLLIGALPASWKLYPPFFERKNSEVILAFADCRCVTTGGVGTVLRLLVSQTLASLYPDQHHWQGLLGELTVAERRLLGRDFKTATPSTLYNVLSLLLTGARTTIRPVANLKVLYVISNIHFLADDRTADLIVQLRAELERRQVHVLITGEPKLRLGKENWGASDFLRVDEDTEYQGMPSSPPLRLRS